MNNQNMQKLSEIEKWRSMMTEILEENNDISEKKEDNEISMTNAQFHELFDAILNMQNHIMHSTAIIFAVSKNLRESHKTFSKIFELLRSVKLDQTDENINEGAYND
jgi:hypothetical protein